MDLDTLIYIIVMIVFIALGAFGKKKKMVPEAQEQESEFDEEIASPEDIIARKLKALLGDYEREQPVGEKIEQEVVYTDSPLEYREKPLEYKREQTVYREPGKTFDDYREDLENQKYQVKAYQSTPQKYSDSPIQSEELVDSISRSGDIIAEGISVFEHYNYDKDNDLTKGDLTMQEDAHSGKAKFDIFAEFSSGFDVRKAIIYSEIINRKQF